MTTECGDYIVLLQSINGFIPVVEILVEGIMIQKNDGCFRVRFFKDAVHPQDCITRDMTIAHAHVGTRCATHKNNAVVTEIKSVATKGFRETHTSAFAPAAIVISRNDVPGNIQTIKYLFCEDDFIIRTQFCNISCDDYKRDIVHVVYIFHGPAQILFGIAIG